MRNVGGSGFRAQRGMALVITLILLAVITFLAVTFLVISRRETGAVTISTDQVVARLAADAALKRAEAEAVATILAKRNPQLFDLLVSTNYVNRLGYNTAQPIGQVWPTNVNYDYNNVGTPLDASRFRQNIGNLLYDPRVPVFVRTNDSPNMPLDFRFYNDLNRNRRFDANGLVPVTGVNGFPILTNGVVLSNTVVGDPEWIGILEKPDEPHSASNRFVARYSFVAVPEGKTLNVNYIYNQALNTSLATNNDGFYRNQGVGTWEINLPAFLCDLNTNLWDPAVAPYKYQRPIFANSGRAFEDAFSIINYRYDGNYGNLKRAEDLFPNTALAFRTDGIDQYSDGPLYFNVPTPDNDNPVTGWAGADNPTHLFTIQDFFDTSKLPVGFADRLAAAGTGNSSYDQYTYYRMLSQLGADSGPEPVKLNLNYRNGVAYTNTDNIVTAIAVDPNMATNLVPWTPSQFFTLAADRMLRAYTTNWFANDRADFVATFNVDRPFGITNIPVWVSNRFVYTPSVERLLQVAANIYDATTNDYTINPSQPLPAFPSVFRPVFQKSGTNLFVVGYDEVPGIQNISDVVLNLPMEADELATNALSDGSIMHSNVYNVPWIIGAKEGLPNFNELGMQNSISVARRLEFRRFNWLNGDPNNVNNPVRFTNQLYTVGVSNVVGVEAWNSYVSAYPRQLQMGVRNEAAVTFSLTNSETPLVGYEIRTNVVSLGGMSINPGTWRGITNNANANVVIPPASFMLPLSANFNFFETNIAYQQSAVAFTGIAANRQRPANIFPFPLMKATLQNRMRYLLLDTSVSPMRVMDYVSISEQQPPVDVTQMLMEGASRQVPDKSAGGGWATNRLGDSLDANVPTVGIMNQIAASTSQNPVEWNSYTYDKAAGNDKDKAVRFFKYQFLPNDPGSDLYKTNIFFAPYNPSRSVYQQIRWQANDPLVHYTVSQLTDQESPNLPSVSGSGNAQQAYNSFRDVNERYRPWGTRRKGERSDNPVDYNPANKDPLVYQSDNWDFPTNKLPNIGWLGRIHRGTPWQTIYMKSQDVDTSQNNKFWRDWSGDASVADSMRTRPMEDRLLFDLFTTAPNENAARGQLSVNQSGLAAWSAVLSGVVTLTNNMSEAPLAGMPPTVTASVIEPAGPAGANSAVGRIVDGINRTRADTNLFPQQVFTSLGDILAVPELTFKSPFLGHNVADMDLTGISDAMYERVPQQIMSLLRLGEPRFVIYSYGQALKPAPNSIYVGDSLFFQLCTNYQVTAEVATRAVVRVEDYPSVGSGNAKPRLVIESFNVLGPD